MTLVSGRNPPMALDCGQSTPELSLHIQLFAGGETDA
jgi:hypothetical protein